MTDIISSLKAYRNKELAIWDAIAQTDIWRADLESVGAISYDNDSHADGGYVFDRISVKIARLLDEEERIRGEIDRQTERRKELLTAIMVVGSEDGRKILRYRFIDALPWDRVCCEVYGEREDFDSDYRHYYNKMHMKAKRALRRLAEK